MSKLWRRFKEAFKISDESAHERLREDRPDSAYGAALSETPSRLSSNDYTELRSGNVLCPSCKGTGWIPREETLVALIPVNDDRLKPKRTILWVSLGIGIVLIIAFILIFMLIPRSVDLLPNRNSVDLTKVYYANSSEKIINFGFTNYVNVSNHNYYSIKVVNTSATVIDKFQPWGVDQLGTGFNSTPVSVGPLSGTGNALYFFNNVTLKGYSASYCLAEFSRFTSLYINMRFEVGVDIEYFNHKEKVTITTTQQVCCVETGNCTSS